MNLVVVANLQHPFGVFEQDNTCQMCGVAAGDADPYHPERTIRLTIGHIVEKDKGGSDEPGNLRAVCSNCNEGLQNIAPPKPDRLQLLTYIRKADARRSAGRPRVAPHEVSRSQGMMA
jgi:5-methylcytosine-specific restriction endonuclease McrA